MIRHGAIFGLTVALALISGAAWSQVGTAGGTEGEGPWSGSASLGYLSTSGNTETTSYNTSLAIAYAVNQWTHAFAAAANGADESDTTTAEAYQASGKSTYDFSEHNYLFGTIDWRRDRFSGVDLKLSESVGYGRRLIDRSAHLLSAEIGVGHRSSELSDNSSESGVIGTLGLDYKWTFSETSNFQQAVSIESGSDNTYLETVSAVRARLLGDFAIVLSYTIRHNTDVPLGNEKTDTFTAISLELAF